MTDMVLDPDYAAFVGRMRRITNIDLSGYKVEQMRRRLTALAARHGAPSLAGFADLMERDVKVRDAFMNFFTINVSEFLRDPQRWHDLQSRILPELIAGSGHAPLTIWSAGCSYGAEPYSLAMVLEELAPGRSYRIIATDIDEAILEQAARGAGYKDSDLRQVSSERRERFFVPGPCGTFAVTPPLKAKVRFLQQDLLTSVPGRGLDLIVCRNVVIYFTEAAKRALYSRMYGALRPGGVLFVGGTEIISGARELGLASELTSFYRKGAARLAGAA